MQLLNYSINELFFSLASNSNRSIKICSPYIKEWAVNSLINSVKSKVELQLITSFNIDNFYKKSSDIEAIKTFNNYNGKIFNNQRLHAKIYIFDENKAIITSANFTTSGLCRNLECGVLIDDIAMVRETNNHFESICNNVDTGKIDSLKIIKVESLLLNMPKYTKNKIEFDLTNETESILEVDNNLITQKLNGWQTIIFNVISSMNKFDFTLQELYNYESIYLQGYPLSVKNWKKIIQRNMQELRDLGLVKFYGHGQYKKLWI